MRSRWRQLDPFRAKENAVMQDGFDPGVVAWITSNVLPHEAELRMRLGRVCKDAAEVDDLLQEVYCRLLDHASLDQVRDARSYVMRIAKNILVDQFRHNTVIQIDAVANLEELEVEDPAPCPERVAMARAELRWVLSLISNLPDRCKQVIRARRVYGLSQNATAQALGLSEGVVEQVTMKAMALISERIESVGAYPAEQRARPKAGRPIFKKRNG
jgi:RNA polymerase sigma-70 factor (ECF subfamily)